MIEDDESPRRQRPRPAFMRSLESLERQRYDDARAEQIRQRKIEQATQEFAKLARDYRTQLRRADLYNIVQQLADELALTLAEYSDRQRVAAAKAGIRYKRPLPVPLRPETKRLPQQRLVQPQPKPAITRIIRPRVKSTRIIRPRPAPIERN